MRLPRTRSTDVDLDFTDPFALPEAPATPKPTAPKVSLDFKDPFEQEAAPPTASAPTADSGSILSKASEAAGDFLSGAGAEFKRNALRGVAGALPGAVGAAHLLGLNSDERDTAVFDAARALRARADAIKSPESLPGKIGGLVGGLGAGIATAGTGEAGGRGMDVIDQGGDVGQARLGAGISGAASIAGLGIPGIGKTVAQRVVGQGLASGVIGEGARRAENEVLPDNMHQDFDPVAAAFNVGVGAAGALLPHGERGEAPAPRGGDETATVTGAAAATETPVALEQRPTPTTDAAPPLNPRAPIATPDDAAILAQRQKPSGPLGVAVGKLPVAGEAPPPEGDTIIARPQDEANATSDQLATRAQPAGEDRGEATRGPSDAGGGVEQNGAHGRLGEPAADDGPATDESADASAVGIANQAKTAERARRNLGPLDAEGKRDFGTVWDRARQTLAEDPQAGNRLTNDVASHPRALNAEESAVLIQHGADLNNRYEQTLRDIESAQKSGDTAAEAQAQVRRRELEEQLQVHDQAARQSGYEQGLGLAMRQALAKRDYSMARQVARFRAIEGGDIPKPVRAKLDTLTKQIADLNEQIRLRDERIAKNAAANGAARTRAAPRTTQQQHEQLISQLKDLVGAKSAPASEANGRVSNATPAETVPFSSSGGTGWDKIEAGGAGTGSSGMARDKLQSAIARTVQGWRGDAPRVMVHQAHNEAPAALRNAPGFGRGVEGAYDPTTRTVHLFADAIRTPVRAAQVLAHEVVGHYGVEGVLGESFGKLVSDITAMRAKPPATMRDLLAEVERRYPGSNDETFASEALAIMAEKGVRNALMDRVIAAVRQFLRSLGINAKFSDHELRQLLVAAHERVAGRAAGPAARGAAQPAFSKVDRTDTPAFKTWFGRSKVTDTQGQPRPVFHGTAEDFNEFRDEHTGRSTGHMTAPLGHFFAEDRGSAQRYAEKASAGVPADERVISAYLSVEKPYTMKLRDFMEIDSQDEARALRAKLQREGYDGIHLPDAGKGQWIAFDSRQVKSTENRGTFDRSNPDIRFSVDADRHEKIAAIVKQMARNRVAAGEKSPHAHALIDWLHGEVGGLTGLSRQQIHEIIAGVHGGTKPTRTELQQRMATIRSQLRAELRNPEARRNATRQAALQRQIDDIQRRIATGDFSKAPRRPFTYDEKTFALEVQRNRVQRQLDALALKREQAQKNPVARFSDFLVKLHRFNILSSPLVVPKLLSAATAKIAVTPLEELAGSVLRHIPGIDRIAAMAPRHGAGFTLGAEREGLRGAFSKETMRGARDQVVQGHDALDELYGDKAYKTQEWTNFMGNIHSALKEPAMLNEFYRSYFHRAQHERARVIGEGMNPDQADAYMQRPSTQAMIGAKAYADGAAAKMQGKNQFADAIDSALRTAKQQGGPMAGLAKLFEIVFPIRKVPLNIVKEITSYAVGGVKAGIGATTWRGELTPERADYILKNLKQQTVGTALLTLGYAFSQYFGGTHQEGDKKRNPNVKPGEAKIGGVEVPELFFHSPAAQTLQIGAGLARIYQQEFAKTHNAFDAGLHALLANYGSTLERGIPYLDQPRRIGNTLKYGRGAGEVVGDQLRSMFVPQIMQRVAQAHDPYKGFRKPKSVAQDVALGIPGLREKVPK